MTKERIAWKNMLARAKQYGLPVDPAWKRFSAFLLDMGYAPEGRTFGRRDRSKGYDRHNCLWETPRQRAQKGGLRRDNTTGISGVTYDKRNNRFQVRLQENGLRIALYSGRDFFEACCRRKSWENSYAQRRRA